MDGLTRWRRRRALRRSDLPEVVRTWLGAPWPAPDRSWRETDFTVLDLETSGLDPTRDDILAIGLVHVTGGRIELSTTWETLVAPPPGKPVGVPAIRVHGLMPDRLLSAPSLASVMPSLVERLVGRVLVIHVSNVDVPFLTRAFRDTWGLGLWMPTLDTARLASWFDDHPLLGGRSGHLGTLRRLVDIARPLGIPVGRQHDALEDALTCAQVLLALATRLEALGHGTLAGLRKTGM